MTSHSYFEQITDEVHPWDYPEDDEHPTDTFDVLWRAFGPDDDIEDNNNRGHFGAPVLNKR